VVFFIFREFLDIYYKYLLVKPVIIKLGWKRRWLYRRRRL